MSVVIRPRVVVKGCSVATLISNVVMISHLRSNHPSVRALGKLEKQLKERAAVR